MTTSGSGFPTKKKYSSEQCLTVTEEIVNSSIIFIQKLEWILNHKLWSLDKNILWCEHNVYFTPFKIWVVIWFVAIARLRCFVKILSSLGYHPSKQGTQKIG
jgi:hypothetical protein